MTINTLSIKAYLHAQAFAEHRLTRMAFFLSAGYLFVDPLCAGITAGDLQAPVVALQEEIFGSGWVTVGKIAAAATGVVMSIAKSSLLPFVIGGLSSGGIHFFQSYTHAAAACLV